MLMIQNNGLVMLLTLKVVVVYYIKIKTIMDCVILII